MEVSAKKLAMGALAGVLMLSLAACGSGTTGSTSGSGDTIKIGIKFDQPGLGLKQGDTYTGMDVDVAKYVADKLGYSESQIEWTQAPSGQRESLIENGQVTYIVGTYSITDKRKEKVSFAGPYFIAGQDLLVRADDTSITGVDALSGKKLCSVTGSTSAQNVKDKVPDVNLQEFGTYSECVAALAAGSIDALTTDDTILAGYAAQEQYKGKLKVVGNTFSTENYGIGLKKGDTELCTKITTAITEMISDGSWQTFVTNNLGPAGFTPGAGNPPTPAACS
ncbi:glutamate ABC transporter substrate-binding protein [Propionicicella superfundia]|uniref:glutamate ABC transporter substrate-binding protein n=1 Tax=Propionicicella superfundia TaxID=348582 RepID=UPI0005666CF0|nr:glutamate ABC transporter substrate-binding protein [Propionicicella superfundia]